VLLSGKNSQPRRESSKDCALSVQTWSWIIPLMYQLHTLMSGDVGTHFSRTIWTARFQIRRGYGWSVRSSIVVLKKRRIPCASVTKFIRKLATIWMYFSGFAVSAMEELEVHSEFRNSYPNALFTSKLGSLRTTRFGLDLGSRVIALASSE